MPEFAYRSLTSAGSVESGRMMADDESDLEARLRARGHYLVAAELPKGPAEAKKPNRAAQRTDGNIPPVELQAFTEYLLSSVHAGIPIMVTLSDVELQMTSKRFRRVIAEVSESMTQDGRSLSESLAEHPKAFSEVFVCTVEAGELTGQLDHALQQLVQYMEWRREIRLQLRQASLYPILIFIVLLALVGVLIVFVYPRLLPIFTSFDTEMPMPTRVVMQFGEFAANYWVHTIAGVFGALFLFGAIHATKRGRMLIDSIRLKIPIFGKLVHQIEMARLVTHLALFFRTGIDLLRGLDMLERLSSNRRVGAAVHQARQAIVQGDSLTHAFAATGLFPPIVLRGLALGEATGQLDESLERTRAYYAREVPAAVRQMIIALQPLLLVVVGGTILFVALSIFLPILGIYDSVGP